MWIGKKIHSIILSLTCHGFRNFPLLIHIPSQPFVNFSKPYELLFSELVTHKMLNVNWEKIHSIIFISHLSWLEKLSPAHTHSLKTFREFFENLYELLFSELESLIKSWMWIGKKIHSIILSVTCHGFRKLSTNSYTSPHNHSWIFETLWVIIFWVSHSCRGGVGGSWRGGVGWVMKGVGWVM